MTAQIKPFDAALRRDEPPPDPTKDEEEALERLQLYAARLSESRRSAIEARSASGIERRWLEDMDAYQGRDGANTHGGVVSTAAGETRAAVVAKTPVTRATTFVQLTRQKANAAAARLSDMLYPTDDRNWSIQPTPIPELMDVLRDHGDEEFKDPQNGNQPLPHPVEKRNVTLGDLAIERMAQATTKSQSMQREIDDALVECSYNYEGRKAILDAAIYGVGILKGPIVVNRIQKKWGPRSTSDGKAVHAIEVIEQTRPATRRVEVWNFFPDPSCGEDIQDGSHVWEREYLSGRALRDLARTESYFANQINECLAEGPRHYTSEGAYHPQARGNGEYNSPTQFDDKRFELWTYTGEATRQDLIACGAIEEAKDEDNASHLEKMSAVVVMCNDRVIKAMLNPLDTEDLPYDVFIWERLAQSPWGVGIPYLMRYAQRSLNTAWRAMLDNATLSHAPQIVMRRAQIVPADGKWEITGRKLWFAGEEVEEVRKAFDIYDIPTRQPELQAIIELAIKFADEETSLPQIAQGEQGSAPETVGGMTILMNSANTVLRRLVKQFDDQITRPHIRRYYDWFMQYSDEEGIKGDFEVDARGSTALIVRDQQQQMLVQLMGAAADPVFGIYVDPEKLFRKTLEAGHLPPGDVMRTREQIAELQAKPKDEAPPVPVQVAQVRAQAAMEAVKLDAASEKVNQELRMQMARDERASRLHEMALERDLMILKYSVERQMQIEDVKAMLAKTVIEQKGKHRDAEANRRVKQADAMARGPGPQNNQSRGIA